MKREDISKAIGGISRKHIEEAAPMKKASKKSVWIKWGAIAACLCLFMAAFPFANIVDHKGNRFDDKVSPPIAALEYNGCCYEACDMGRVLEKFGLPDTITADMAGEHLSYLEPDGAGYKETAAQTDIELYQYAPFPCRSVYVLRDGEDYMAALFCNFRQFDTNTNHELSELYRLYGINGAEDIASISHTDWDEGKVIGNTITAADAISEFYAITTSLASYGNDDFQALVFEGIPEEEQAAAHVAYADDNTTIRVETVSGLRFFILFFPNYGWMESSGAMSYYQMNEAMYRWFDQYIQ